jgi:hypothetical protein
MESHKLLQSLLQDVNNITRIVETDFTTLSDEQLNWKENQKSWSILECFEHLNRYSRYYNSTIEKAIRTSKASHKNEDPKSTWMGKKFINMMSPGNVKKQKTMGHLNPINSKLDKKVITEFLKHQQQLKSLVEQAEKSNLNSVKVPVEFLKLLKMNLGDALQFIVVHEQRHLIQLQNILAKVKHSLEPALKV